MKNTEYLTGEPDSYFEPEQSKLAEKRINAINKLLRTLASERDSTEAHKIEELLTRYTEAEKAKAFWVALLDTQGEE